MGTSSTCDQTSMGRRNAWDGEMPGTSLHRNTVSEGSVSLFVDQQVASSDDRPPLRRCREGRWIGGVCAGLSRRLGVGVGWVRAVFVIGGAIPILPGFPLYLLLWLLVPLDEASARRKIVVGVGRE